ncbi:MAG: fused MFS/spermidine synthase [Candidatus Eremiobacteraeota bacterium]|nr:fused MFS/spermidine synthase [Candidatus Eremiobacteraeota bacterium]
MSLRAGRGIVLFFFLSGALGLVYEVVWTRLLLLIIGSTVYAVSTVLTVFMTGLALGSFFAGKAADRSSRPLFIYGCIEGILGIYMLLLPAILGAAENLYLHALPPLAQDGFLPLRILVCFMVLLVPSSLMGATLPLVTRFFTEKRENIGFTGGTLYALNTAGAVAGAFAAGFIAIPYGGVQMTLTAAALANLLIFLGVIILRFPAQEAGEHQEEHCPGDEERHELPWPAHGAFMAGFAIAGFTSLIYENIWTRLLGMIFGNTVYGMSTMLTAFLAGIALGSALMARCIKRLRRPFLAFAVLEVAVGFAVLGGFPLINSLPSFFLSLYHHTPSAWALHMALKFLGALLLMLPPTLCAGAAFPLAAVIHGREPKRLGTSIGTVYAVNTAGAIAGAFAGGFLMIPLWGIQNALILTLSLNILTGLALIAISPDTREKQKAILIGTLTLAAALGTLFLSGIDRAVFTTGVYYAPYRISAQLRERRITLSQYAAGLKFAYFREGRDATVAVIREGKDLVLKVNGKVDASTFEADLKTQITIGHLPLLLHRQPRKALLIGMGSGITLGSALTHPLERLDCLEISSEVVEAARCFSDFHHHALDDRRLRIVVNDGRNHLLSTDEHYDVIISEPSNPWVSGASSLFTRESYELMRSRLSPGGIACQWVQGYHMEPRLFRMLVATFSTVFPSSSLWDLGGDTILIGSNEEVPFDYCRMKECLHSREISEDLARIGIKSPRDLFFPYILDGESMKRYREGTALNTDDRPQVEFFAPRTLYVSFQKAIQAGLLAGRKEPLFIPMIVTGGPWEEVPLAAKKESGITVEREGYLQSVALERFRREEKPLFELTTLRPVLVMKKEGKTIEVFAGPGPFPEKGKKTKKEGTISMGGHKASWRLEDSSGEPVLSLTWRCPAARLYFLAEIRAPGSAPEALEVLLHSISCHR